VFSRLCDMVDLSHVFSRLSALKLRSADAEEQGQTTRRRTSFSTSENICLMSVDILLRISAASETVWIAYLRRNIASCSAVSSIDLTVGLKLSFVHLSYKQDAFQLAECLQSDTFSEALC